jgi:SAM-dependent methyltransferase
MDSGLGAARRPRIARQEGYEPGITKQEKSMTATARRPLWKQFEHRHVKPLLRGLKPWRSATLGGIRVSFKTHLDGGGSSFGQDFIPFLRDRGMPRVPRAFEWCAGPGFIGFSLLGHGLCESLCVADVNPEAVAACRRTVALNGLGGQVSVYHSDNLAGIPPAEQWDLVVSNPPHFDETTQDLRSSDSGWHIHRCFFDAVGRFLKPGGVIVLQENNAGSTLDDFRPLIEQACLSIVFTAGGEPVRTPDFRVYFIGLMRRSDASPAWAQP